MRALKIFLHTMYFLPIKKITLPGRVGQLVTCLTADICLTADPGVASLIPAQSHTFAEIDHEIISTAILFPSIDSRRVVVSYILRKYVHEVLVNCLVKLAQEKSVVRWTDRADMTIAVDWDVKNQTNEKKTLHIAYCPASQEWQWRQVCVQLLSKKSTCTLHLS